MPRNGFFLKLRFFHTLFLITFLSIKIILILGHSFEALLKGYKIIYFLH